MDNSAELAANQVLSFLVNHGLLSWDSMKISGWNLAGLELEMRSIIRLAYGQPDEDIPFTDDALDE